MWASGNVLYYTVLEASAWGILKWDTSNGRLNTENK